MSCGQDGIVGVVLHQKQSFAGFEIPLTYGPVVFDQFALGAQYGEMLLSPLNSGMVRPRSLYRIYPRPISTKAWNSIARYVFPNLPICAGRSCIATSPAILPPGQINNE